MGYWGNGLVGFPIWVLQVTGALLSPYDGHAPTARVSGSSQPIDSAEWFAWMERLLALLDDAHWRGRSSGRSPGGAGIAQYQERPRSRQTSWDAVSDADWSTTSAHEVMAPAPMAWSGDRGVRPALDRLWLRYEALLEADEVRLPDLRSCLSIYTALMSAARRTAEKTGPITLYVVPYVAVTAMVSVRRSVVLTPGVDDVGKVFLEKGLAALEALSGGYGGDRSSFGV